jgi:hypothetical protein
MSTHLPPSGNDLFHAFTLPTTEILFVGITMIITTCICVLDAFFGDNTNIRIIDQPIGFLIVWILVAAVILMIGYDHLLNSDGSSVFFVFMKLHTAAVYYFVAATCVSAGLTQVLMLKNYRRSE